MCTLKKFNHDRLTKCASSRCLALFVVAKDFTKATGIFIHFSAGLCDQYSYDLLSLISAGNVHGALPPVPTWPLRHRAVLQGPQAGPQEGAVRCKFI